MEKGRTNVKRKKGTKAKLKRRESEEEQEETHEFDLPGVTTVTLSLLTQKAIGCVIGENVTSENPWIYIPKEKVEDNIELHDESSEFLALKEDITNYPEPEFLLGYNVSKADVREQFYLCLTTEAKNNVLTILDQQRELLQEKLRSSLVKTPGEWISQGSEVEIDESMVRSFRPLMQVQHKTVYPIFNTSKKFCMRNTEDAIDGYVELLSTRQTFNNVMRKRVDAGVQAAPYTKTHVAQTNPTYPQSKWTQYKFEYEEIDVSKPVPIEVVDFVNAHVDDLCDKVNVNKAIDFYADDFEHMGNDVPKPVLMDIPLEFVLQDVVSCQGKKVSCMCWHPTISGLLLVSYVNVPMKYFIQEPLTRDTVNESIHGKNIALLWSYSDNLIPKLYLDCHREVSSITFCEQDPNIVIAGCENGQVIIWDITGKLEKVESREVLSTTEQKHRQIMYSLMKWMKNTSDVAYVQPTAISAINHSHSQPVTEISCIPPRYSVTRNGKVEYDPEGESLQFITAGLDGAINIWDLRGPPPSGGSQHMRRAGRLKTRPSALTLNISWLKALDKLFVPKFRLIVQDIHSVPISSLCTQKIMYSYTALNPETMRNIYERTYYEKKYLEDQNPFTPSFYIGTATGKLLKVSWEGNDFDQGQVVNSEVCKVSEFMSFHDGPIRGCTRNPKSGSYLLTVGGKIIMIWHVEHVKPLIWRKSEVEYVTAMWSSTMINLFITCRIDGYSEIWNLQTQVTHPVAIVHITSNTILDIVTDNQKLHVRKDTVCMTDNTGAVHVLKAPDLFSSTLPMEIERATSMLTERAEKKMRLHKWIENWQQTQTEHQEQTAEQTTDTSTKEEEKVNNNPEPATQDTFDKILTQKWESKQEQFMYETLLKKKKLNLKEIIKEAIPLQQDREKRRALERKETQRLAEKEQVFEKAKAVLFKETLVKERRRIPGDYGTGLSDAELKKLYIDNYNSLVSEVSNKIKQKPFRYAFKWSSLVSEGTERRRKLTNIRENLHLFRFDEESKQKTENERGNFETVSKIPELSEEEASSSTIEKF